MHFVKVANRPQLEIGETEINFLNAVTWIPGKGRWQPMSVSYYDVTHAEMANLYTWIGHVYNFQFYHGGEIVGGGGLGGVGAAAANSNANHLPQSEKEGYAAKGILKVLDGCGNDLEHWELTDCWPQSINWGDLGYENSDECTIDLTVRYSRAKLINTPCMKLTTPECVGCT
jgi:hypothetical protein